nr:hypothetical protein [Tanacetum cinerariifolium]
MATIAKSSTLPHDSAPRVTSPAADEGNMQQIINELTAFCTSVQRQHSELLAKFQDQEVEINRLKERVKLLEDRDGVAVERSKDDAPINRRSLDEGEAVAERVSNDSEEMATVLTSIDAATVLAGGIDDVPTGSRSIPIASLPTDEVPTGSDVAPTASPVFTTATVVTPYRRRKGKEVMVESDTPKKQKVQEQIDAQEYHQFASELPIKKRIELISDLVKYQDNYAKIYKFQSQQRKSWTKNQKRDYYMAMIRSNLGWKVKDFRGMTFEEVEAKFNSVWKQIEDFIPMGSKEEAERIKRKGLSLEQESAKKFKPLEEVTEEAKSPNEVPEEKIKEMMQLVPIEEVLVKETLSNRPPTSKKEMELWVELSRLYEPDDEDQLWTHTQNLMHALVEWKLYVSCGVHHVTAKYKEIFMLVEKDYPLKKGLALVMISYKLQVENYSMMENDLILKIYKISSALRQQGIEFPLDYALETATRILNTILTKKVYKTPYELWYGKVPNLSYLNIYGCEALVKHDMPDKLQQRSIKCIFVGDMLVDDIRDVTITNDVTTIHRKPFAFARFNKVNDVDLLIRNLRSVWLGNFHMYANVACFNRDTKPSSSPNLAYNKPFNVPKPSFVNVVKGKEVIQNRDAPMMILEQGSLNYEGEPALVGCVKDFKTLPNIHNVCSSEGFNRVKISYLGGFWILLEFDSFESCEKFRTHEGTPLRAWSQSTFNNIASRWDKLVYMDDSNASNKYSMRLCVKTMSQHLTAESFKVILKGKVFVICAKEVTGWVPEFGPEISSIRGSEETNSSEPKFPPGFTPLTSNHPENATTKVSHEGFPSPVSKQVMEDQPPIQESEKPTNNLVDEGITNFEVKSKSFGGFTQEHIDFMDRPTKPINVYYPQELPLNRNCGVTWSRLLIDGMARFIANSHLIRIPLFGYSFTWSDKHANRLSSKSLMWTMVLFFFVFFDSSFLEQDFSSVIEDSWNNDGVYASNSMVLLKNKLKFLKQRLKMWSKDKKSIMEHDRKVLHDSLIDLDLPLDKGNGLFDDVSTRTKLLHDLHLAIKEVLIDGEWIDNPSRVKSEFYNHFVNRFSAPEWTRAPFKGQFLNRLDIEQSCNFEIEVTNEEIKKASWDCGSDNSPGPDGFTFEF